MFLEGEATSLRYAIVGVMEVCACDRPECIARRYFVSWMRLDGFPLPIGSVLSRS
jgi:hypothetical protein